jgi:hypothetical protein
VTTLGQKYRECDVTFNTFSMRTEQNFDTYIRSNLSQAVLQRYLNDYLEATKYRADQASTQYTVMRWQGYRHVEQTTFKDKRTQGLEKNRAKRKKYAANKKLKKEAGELAKNAEASKQVSGDEKRAVIDDAPIDPALEA